MSVMASQITSLTIVFSNVYSDTDERKHQSSASLVGEFSAQMVCNAENVSIWLRHHALHAFFYQNLGADEWEHVKLLGYKIMIYGLTNDKDSRVKAINL